MHNQKIQHYILGKNPTSVQNAIMLAQKKDVELKIIEGLHNHDLHYEIHKINLSQDDRPDKPGPCHACNGPHFIKDCNEATCLIPSKCPRRHLSN